MGLHAAVLFIICLTISTTVNVPRYIPAFIPLFVLAFMPVMFRCQYYGMSEMEAVTSIKNYGGRRLQKSAFLCTLHML